MRMVSYLPALISFLTAIIIIALSRRARFRYIWLVSAIGAFVVFATVLAAWLIVPLDPGAASFPLGTIFDPALRVRWDTISSSLSLAMASLLLAVVLSDVQRSPTSDWRAYGGSFLAASVTLVGLVAGNFFTLALFMGLADFVIIAILLLIQSEQTRIDRAVSGFVLRGAGLMVLVLAVLVQQVLVPNPTPSVEIIFLGLLLAGFYLRLGSLPPRWASLSDFSRDRSLGTVLKIGPASLAILFLLRVGDLPVSDGLLNLVLLLIALSSAIFAWVWLRSYSEIAGRNSFLTAGATLLVASILLGQPESGLAWSLALLLSGSVLLLFKTRRTWFVLLPFLGFWGLTGLPLSASWEAMQVFTPPFPGVLLSILIGQAILLTGYLIHTLRVDPEENSLERWEQVLYPLGLAVLPATNLLLVWLPWRGLEAIQGIPWWPGFIVTALGVGLWWLVQRGLVPELKIPRSFARVSGLPSAASREVVGWFSRVVGFISFLLEGQGGVLWALLLLALMITLLAQLSLNVTGNGS